MKQIAKKFNNTVKNEDEKSDNWIIISILNFYKTNLY